MVKHHRCMPSPPLLIVSWWQFFSINTNRCKLYTIVNITPRTFKRMLYPSQAVSHNIVSSQKKKNWKVPTYRAKWIARWSEVFARFSVDLPRNSSHKSKAINMPKHLHFYCTVYLLYKITMSSSNFWHK